jgi:enoyl-CoA hydratase/carnithine racemase
MMTADAIQSVHPVLLEHLEDHVARITLNRPNARNAVTGDLANSLERAVRDTETDSEVRVVVLTGAGRGFCAGTDLAEVAAGREAALWTESGGSAGFVKSVRRKPWLAAVHGFAFAGGLEIALSRDLIVASEDARFGLPEVDAPGTYVLEK